MNNRNTAAIVAATLFVGNSRIDWNEFAQTILLVEKLLKGDLVERVAKGADFPIRNTNGKS